MTNLEKKYVQKVLEILENTPDSLEKADKYIQLLATGILSDDKADLKEFDKAASKKENKIVAKEEKDKTQEVKTEKTKQEQIIEATPTVEDDDPPVADLGEVKPIEEPIKTDGEVADKEYLQDTMFLKRFKDALEKKNELKVLISDYTNGMIKTAKELVNNPSALHEFTNHLRFDENYLEDGRTRLTEEFLKSDKYTTEDCIEAQQFIKELIAEPKGKAQIKELAKFYTHGHYGSFSAIKRAESLGLIVEFVNFIKLLILEKKQSEQQ